MKISKKEAYELWEATYGSKEYAKDFDGRLMYKHAYGDPNYYEYHDDQKVYCGWNIHHILPRACGGCNTRENLICTNIITNELAADKTSYWIDGHLYQVKKIKGTHEYEIERIV